MVPAEVFLSRLKAAGLADTAVGRRIVGVADAAFRCGPVSGSARPRPGRGSTRRFARRAIQRPVRAPGRPVCQAAATLNGSAGWSSSRAPGEGVRTVGDLLDEFLAEQKRRVENRRKLDARRAKGENVQEPPKANIGEARYNSILRDEKTFRASVGKELWDGTEGTAARIVKKYRDRYEPAVVAGENSTATFDEKVKFAQAFVNWADENHYLDRPLRHGKKLFAKYGSKPTPKAIPVEVLKKLWKAADDRLRAWMILGLNCGYYQNDISDLTADMVGPVHLDHFRTKAELLGSKTANVKYKLWPLTKSLLDKTRTDGGKGHLWLTDEGTTLVNYSPKKKGEGTSKSDNVRNAFYRLCEKAGVKGYSFSNVRDTGSTAVEQIDRAYTDLYGAHTDKRMARFYADGKMIDTTGIDRIIDALEPLFVPALLEAQRESEASKPSAQDHHPTPSREPSRDSRG